jgi:phosphate butyryltransferase
MLFERLLAACRGLPPIPTAVACPDDAASLSGVMTAARSALIEPVLVGEASRIRACAKALDLSIDHVPIIEAAGEHEAAERAVALVHEGRVRAVMKGSLHTAALLSKVVRRDSGLRESRRLSHVFVVEAPGCYRLLFVSDAALNIAPTLSQKLDIVANAVELAAACGASPPRVALLAAVETVSAEMPATIEAAALAKMAERGQLGAAIVDGPLAMDNAVSPEAASAKGIRSAVAGRADVLITPTIEAANMLVKSLTFVGGADCAGLVVGGRVPVMLTSRADSARAHQASCALALLLDSYRQTGRSRIR